MSQTNEGAFEIYVEEILLTRGGWRSGGKAEWDNKRALFPAEGSNSERTATRVRCCWALRSGRWCISPPTRTKSIWQRVWRVKRHTFLR